MKTNPVVLTKCEYADIPGRWKYKLTSDFSVRYPGVYFGTHEFADDMGRVWASGEKDVWTTKAGYAWDGSSCVPDDQASLWASNHHDSQGQFRHIPCLAAWLSGQQWNQNYRNLMAALGSPIRAKVYYAGLVLFNPVYQWAGKLIGATPAGKCLVHENRPSWYEK
jgi:hypothetical protein